MSSGIYIIAGGGFFVAGTASVTGSGVMIFNAGSNYPGHGGTYGSITLGGNATLGLSPATSGTYAGIVFFQPLDNTNALTVSGNTSGITGTIYAPAARLSESGQGALDASLIVDTLTISGNAVADSLTLVATSGVVGLTVTTSDLSVPSAPAASPSSSSSSTALTALDLALDDPSMTAAGASWVNNVSDAPSLSPIRVVLASSFGIPKRGIGQFQA